MRHVLEFIKCLQSRGYAGAVGTQNEIHPTSFTVCTRAKFHRNLPITRSF